MEYSAIAVDYSGVQMMTGFIREFPKRVGAALMRTAVQGQKWIMQMTPKDTGNAKNSFTIVNHGDLEKAIASIYLPGARYTPFLEAGTYKYGPYGVMPQTAFQKRRDGSPTKAATRIKGGMPGSHMVENNMQRIEKNLNEQMQAEYAKVTGKPNGV